MKKERLSIKQVIDENTAREFLVSKLVDLVKALDKGSKKDIKRQELSYESTEGYIKRCYGLDTTPYNRLAIKLLKGTF